MLTTTIYYVTIKDDDFYILYDFNFDRDDNQDHTIKHLNYDSSIMIVKSCSHDQDLSTIIPKGRNCDQDDSQDHTINDFDTHYGSNGDWDDN